MQSDYLHNKNGVCSIATGTTTNAGIAKYKEGDCGELQEGNIQNPEREHSKTIDNSIFNTRFSQNGAIGNRDQKSYLEGNIPLHKDQTSEMSGMRVDESIDKPTSSEKLQTEDGEEGSYHYDDEEIKRDAANDTVAFLVHIALVFFIFIFFTAIAIAVIAVSQYGFVTFMVLTSLLAVVIISGYFIVKVFANDAKLKPVQRKLRRWQAIATAVIVKELKDFQLDMNEHLLLMNGNLDDSETVEKDEQSGEDGLPKSTNHASDKKRKKKGTRSLLFRLVKPLLRKKEKGGFKHEKKNVRQQNEGYAPPPVNEII